MAWGAGLLLVVCCMLRIMWSAAAGLSSTAGVPKPLAAMMLQDRTEAETHYVNTNASTACVLRLQDSPTPRGCRKHWLL